MPPTTRKRSAPLPPPEDDSSSGDERSVEMNEPSTSSTSKRKYKCSVNDCGKLLTHSESMRVHYRKTHSKEKPYKCTFSSCNQAHVSLSEIYDHIRNVHQLQSKLMARKYVQVQKEVLDEETKQLGIKSCFRGIVFDDVILKDNHDSLPMPTLPSFTTIQRTSTGHFICPLNECDHQETSMTNLKVHYRVHCDNEYRPFRCKFTDSCRYAAKQKTDVEKHIRVKHFHVPRSVKKWNETAIDDDQRNEADFIETRNDWLQMENDLFGSAQIISPPDIQKSRPFACTFENCSKTFLQIHYLRCHIRTHRQLKPFKCSFSNCDHTVNIKSSLLRHIHSVHFNIPRREQKNLSQEAKQRAEQYVEVNEDMLAQEEAQVAPLCVRQKKGRRNRTRKSTEHHLSDDSPDYCQVRFDDDTSEDEDDKDQLTSLLTTSNMPSTSFN